MGFSALSGHLYNTSFPLGSTSLQKRVQETCQNQTWTFSRKHSLVDMTVPERLHTWTHSSCDYLYKIKAVKNSSRNGENSWSCTPRWWAVGIDDCRAAGGNQVYWRCTLERLAALQYLFLHPLHIQVTESGLKKFKKKKQTHKVEREK